MSAVNEYLSTPLHSAATNLYPAATAFLLELLPPGAVDQPNNKGHTALHKAANAYLRIPNANKKHRCYTKYFLHLSHLLATNLGFPKARSRPHVVGGVRVFI